MSHQDYNPTPRTRSATDPANTSNSVQQHRAWHSNDTSTSYGHRQHLRPGPPLPPIRQMPSISNTFRPTLPPLQLPSLPQLQIRPDVRPSPSTRAIKIDSLLAHPAGPVHDPNDTRQRYAGLEQQPRTSRSDHARNARSLDRPPFPSHHGSQVITSSDQVMHPRPSPSRVSRATSRSSTGERSPQSPSTASVSSARSGRDTPVIFSPHISTPKMRPPPPPFNYTLIVRQQPSAARACGYGERDRRHVDPPPIVELKITDPVTGLPVQDSEAILAVHCNLMQEDGSTEVPNVPHENPNRVFSPAMMGQSVASNSDYKDERGIAGHFFVFPDLSCRFPGNYRLRFKLLRIDPTNIEPGRQAIPPAYVTTNIFRVYIAKDFPGMEASSPLLKTLKAQGLQVGLKKGSEERKKKAKARNAITAAPASPSSDEDDSGEDEMEHAVMRKKALHSSPQHKRQRLRI